MLQHGQQVHLRVSTDLMSDLNYGALYVSLLHVSLAWLESSYRHVAKIARASQAQRFVSSLATSA